ncbi:translesion DNA synthesis-associated protein ImuA [Cupriavidus sp. BIS7]|uniref:translesion DNA synthesis-associated protein ImuA n=1 Tax=Cupriavidus sp. BIS7 TaxID=1217718 RepID=UPI0002F75E58|nr:translesion DNA synthesis-associated protein ImuA [Cupriavidus sp. BIS7]
MTVSSHAMPPAAAADHAPPIPVHRASVSELEHRYPGLWRAGQLGRAGRLPVCPTGYDALTAELPGGGWPAGAVTELLLAQDGAGELRLLMPALRTLAAAGRRIGFVNPPYLPNAAGLADGRLPARQLYWVRPPAGATIASRRADMLWAAEQMLRSQAFGAVLVWLAGARPEALRRLQVLAQAGDTVVWVLRPIRVLHESSPATLRLALSPLPGNLLSIVFHKRRGPARDTPLLLPLEGMAHVPRSAGAPAVPTPAVPAGADHHVPDASDLLDRGAPAAPAAGRAAAELA